MLKCYDLNDGRVIRCPEGQPGMIQVYSSPTDEERYYLIEQCGIDEHTLNSALDEDEISRSHRQHAQQPAAYLLGQALLAAEDGRQRVDQRAGQRERGQHISRGMHA